MNVDEILKALGPGAGPVLALFIGLLYTRKVVFGWQYEEMTADRDYWRNVAEHGLTTAETSTKAAATAIEKAQG